MTSNQTNPTPLRGHYSLIQFCPEPARLETANIGVALYCRDADFLSVQMSGKNRRIVKMFGRGEHDLNRLRAVKASLQEAIERRDGELDSLDQLQKFAALQVSDCVDLTSTR